MNDVNKNRDQNLSDHIQKEELEIQYDENQITDVVSRFFMQSSETRLKYMNGFKDLLQANIKKQLTELQDQIQKGSGKDDQKVENNKDDILDNSQEDELDANALNPPPEFIEIVLQYIYNIYIKEYEDKKMTMPEAEQDQIKVEDVFDENDKQLIEDLQTFMDQYQLQQLYIQQQKKALEDGGDLVMDNQDVL